MRSVVLVLVLISGGTAAAQNIAPPDVREMGRKVMMPVVYRMPGMDVHGFDNQTDDERSREIIRGAIAFMRVHLKAT